MKIFYLIFYILFFSFSLEGWAGPIVNVNEKDLVDEQTLEKIEEAPQAKILEELKESSEEPQNIGLVLDSSGSMGQILEKNKTKMFFLKKMIKDFSADQWKLRNNIGVRVYGSRVKGKCDDIVQTTPYSDRSLMKLERSLEAMEPIGMTPLHTSIQMTVDEIKKLKGPKKIVIVTDGEDTCGGDPCKSAEKIKQENLDITFYVVALGFQGNSDALTKLSCLGDVHMAEDEESFSDAMSQVSSKINKNQNLKVISPNPNSPVYLYRIDGDKKKLDRVFYASAEQTVPEGSYEALVMFNPPYKFPQFVVPPKRKVVLKVEGDGEVKVNFFGGHLRTQILDNNNKVVVKGKSDEKLVVPSGKWKLRVYRDPFFEILKTDYYVYPKSDQKFDVYSAGVVKVETAEPQGVYIYDAQNALIDYTLSNTPFVLKTGLYAVHVNEECTFSDVVVKDKKEVLVLSCVP